MYWLHRSRLLIIAIVSFLAAINSSFIKKTIALLLSSIFGFNSIAVFPQLGDSDRVNAAMPTSIDRMKEPSNQVSPIPKVADVCVFGICAPVKLPEPVEGLVTPLLDNVVKDKIRSLLADEIPINGSKHNFYKNLSTLPGQTFNPSTLYLTAISPNRQIPAGDYQIPVHFYCTGVYTFNGRGNRFALAQLNGRMADVLSALYNRASYQKQIPISDIQSLAWSIQSGMAYNELSPGHKLLVTQLIPEYRDRMERGFIERLDGISSQVSRLSGGKIPDLNRILNQLGTVGEIAQTALRARQEILRTNFKAQALAETFSPNRDFFLNGGTDKTPWSQVQNNVYMRFIAPSGAMRDGVVDVRVPNGGSVSSKTLLAEITKSVGVSEGSGGQGIQATVTPIPKDKQATLPPQTGKSKPGIKPPVTAVPKNRQATLPSQNRQNKPETKHPVQKEPKATPSPENLKIDPLKVARGQLTFDAEGQECPNPSSGCHKYHSRKPHVPPGGSSGVTIGRGYDLKRRPSQEIKQHLIAAGLRPEDAEEYAKAGCVQKNGECKPQFQGKKAEQFVIDNKNKLVEITPEQQQKLFEIVYVEKEKEVNRISNKEKNKWGGSVNWKDLDPRIKDIAVDLIFRGDYIPESRAKIQKYLIENNFIELKKIMADSYWLQKNNAVPRDRFNRRNDYLNQQPANQNANPQ
jgi:hypothetical protein